MQTSLIAADHLEAYAAKEFGPIMLAFAFVLSVGGLTAAALVLCGWRGARSMSMSWSHNQVAIVCR